MANLTSGHPCLVGRDEPSHQCTQRHRLKIGNEDQLNIEQKNRICDLCLLNVPETECHFWNTWEYWAWFSRIPAGLIVAFHTPIPVPVNHKTWLMEDQNNEIQQLTVFYMLVLLYQFQMPLLHSWECVATIVVPCCHGEIYIIVIISTLPSTKWSTCFMEVNILFSFSWHEHHLILHLLRVSSTICNLSFLF